MAKVKPPAMTLLVITGISMVLVVLGIVLNVLGIGMMATQGGLGQQETSMMMFQGTIGLVSGVIGLLVGGFVIYGCLQAMQLKSYGLVLAAFIVSMIPFISPCCIAGLPIGIWGVVVLNDPLVKSSFR